MPAKMDSARLDLLSSCMSHAAIVAERCRGALAEPRLGAVQWALTVWEVGVAQLQIFARPGRVVLSAHWKLHVLNILLQ